MTKPLTKPSSSPVTEPVCACACRLYERALAYVGTDYFAHAVWDKYVAYEHGISHGLAVAALYSRALGLPLRDLERYRRE